MVAPTAIGLCACKKKKSNGGGDNPGGIVNPVDPENPGTGPGQQPPPPDTTPSVTAVTITSTSPQFVITAEKKLRLEMGQEVQLAATVTGNNLTSREKDVKWKTSDSTVATISNGYVHAFALGTTVITATSDFNPNVSGTITIDVKYPDPTGKETPPSAPLNFRISKTPVRTTSGISVELSWDVPADSGGSPIIGYYISSNNGYDGTYTSIGNVLTKSYTYELVNGKTYNFKVYAQSYALSGKVNAASLPVQIDVEPGTISSLALSRTGNEETGYNVKLSWDKRTDVSPNGREIDSTVTSYEVLAIKSGEAADWSKSVSVPVPAAGVNTAEYTFTNTDATTFYVRAVNAKGTGIATIKSI